MTVADNSNTIFRVSEHTMLQVPKTLSKVICSLQPLDRELQQGLYFAEKAEKSDNYAKANSSGEKVREGVLCVRSIRLH